MLVGVAVVADASGRTVEGLVDGGLAIVESLGLAGDVGFQLGRTGGNPPACEWIVGFRLGCQTPGGALGSRRRPIDLKTNPA